MISELQTNITERFQALLKFFKRQPKRFSRDDETGVHTHQALRNLYNGFRILGINMPEDGNKYLYILYSFCINTAVTIWLPLAFLISYTKMSADEMKIGNLLTSVQVAINVLGCSLKIIVMSFMLKKLRAADPLLERMDARCSDPDEIQEIRKVVIFGNRMVVLFTIAYWSYSTSTFVSAFFAGLPGYGTYNPFFDWQKSRTEFVATAVMEIILMDIACFQQVVDDSYAVIYVGILRTHLQILLMKVQKLCTNPEKTADENLEELKQCILDHKNLLQLYNIIAPVISITIFIQFTITATLLGTTLINIMLFATDFAARVASCFYILAVVVEVFPLCYYAQCLMDESNRLAGVIFHSAWMEQPPSYRNLLVFYMQRSQRTIELTAGKLFPITLNSFLSIAKFSFTLYTFIKEMGIKERFGLE